MFFVCVAGAIPTRAQTTQPAGAHSTEEQIRGLLLKLADKSSDVHHDAISQLGHARNPRLLDFLHSYSQGSAYVYQGAVVLCPRFTTDEQGHKLAPLLDALTQLPIEVDGKPLAVPSGELQAIDAGRRERLWVRDAQTLLNLTNPDREIRLDAVVRAGEGGQAATIPVLQGLLPEEEDAKVHRTMQESIALLQLADSTTPPPQRVSAIATLGQLRSARALARLQKLQTDTQDQALKDACAVAVGHIESWQRVVAWTGYIFSGLSSGSVLVLMALGLSIIFGVMGVINMAHGELMMIGAYATYLTQRWFDAMSPAHGVDWYFLAAIPFSFLAAAIFGMLMETLLIRRLYGRPLDTLLATWGVSLVLIQLVRLQYGDNIAVNSPTWLRGGMEVATDIILPYNRCFILLFCGGCIGLMYFIMDRTKLGLLMRATTQNRAMASSLGVPTRRVDAYTFALGAGLAGLAGCALTQIGGVTPDMGQNYIVDSFMVVVTGGVGKLAGAIWAGLGLGVINKLLEPAMQTVWAKVVILLLVIVFLQRRPSGLFPAKGRLADA